MGPQELRSLLKAPAKCPDCGGMDHEIHTTVVLNPNTSGLVNGRLYTRDVQSVVFVGCTSCSCTIVIVPIDDIVNAWNNVLNSTRSAGTE